MEKGYSSVDVERVDMYKYPTLSKLPWYIANMDTGDCLYIPMNWYHHVNSSLTRNLAINLWWREHENGFEHREECEKSLHDIPEYDRLFNYHLSSGIKVEDLTFSEAFAENGTTTLRNLLRTVARLSPRDMEKEDLRNTLKDVKVIFIHSDINDDKILTVKELESFVQTDLLEPFIKEDSNYYKQNQYKDKNDEL
uniref:JmjC domain-containing protein n=1 Tax=Ciona savignyi TaxID=51511 RepID=H2YG20_CIOSA